jgi:CRP-like cAMP-binding protein
MPYGTPPRARQLEHGKFNRFLATLPPHDFSLLAPHLRTIALERGMMLHDVGEEIEHVYFPHTGMVSLVAVMQSGATVETATVGRGGVVGASAGLGARRTFGRAVVQLPGTAAWIQRPDFMRLPVKAEPFAISSCATTSCCWPRSNNRSRATRSMAWRPGFAAGYCRRTIASTATPYR